MSGLTPVHREIIRHLSSLPAGKWSDGQEIAKSIGRSYGGVIGKMPRLETMEIVSADLRTSNGRGRPKYFYRLNRAVMMQNALSRKPWTPEGIGNAINC